MCQKLLFPLADSAWCALRREAELAQLRSVPLTAKALCSLSRACAPGAIIAAEPLHPPPLLFFFMPAFFGKKKSNPPPPHPHPPTPGTPPSPEKKTKGYFVRERSGKDARPKSPRSSKSFSRSNPYEHPLNLPPDELRRLSALSTSMSSPRDSREDGGVPLHSDPMETTPAPETPGSFPQTNGVNGEHHDDEEQENRPTPPPHRTPTSPQPQAEKSEKPAKPEIREAEAEAYKAAGNKLYKAGQYGSAIDEYTKGRCFVGFIHSRSGFLM